MSYVIDGYSYWATANRLVWSTPQDSTTWSIGDNMARNNDRRINYEIQEVENGYIVVKGNSNGGYGNTFVFNTIKEVNDFISKQNAEVMA